MSVSQNLLPTHKEKELGALNAIRAVKRKTFNPSSAKKFCHLKLSDPVMAEVVNLLEAEAASSPAAAPGPDIPAHREQLAILVSTGKCKEVIGADLTHDQVKRLDDKDVMKYSKRHEAHVGAKTTETLIESFLSLSTKVLGWAVKIKDVNAPQKELKNDYIITKEMSTLSGGLALRCGRLLAVANAFLIIAKHVDFTADEQVCHPSRDKDGYPLSGVDEVPNAEQYPTSLQ